MLSMERMWNDDTSLETMQQQISDIFRDKLGGETLICDVFKPDPQDYELLYRKAILISNTELFMKYPLAFITAWALSFKYGKSYDIIEVMRRTMGTMPQHHARFIIDFFTATFHDYNIYTDGINIKTLRDIRKVVELQHERYR